MKARSSAPGLSLIEVMVTVVILGFLAQMAVLAFGGARQGADEQKDKRNAQEISSVATMASAAGAIFVVDSDEAATIANLRQGTAPAKGPFRGRTFKLSNMEDGDVAGAMRYLVLSADSLLYRPDGSQ